MADGIWFKAWCDCGWTVTTIFHHLTQLELECHRKEHLKADAKAALPPVAPRPKKIGAPPREVRRRAPSSNGPYIAECEKCQWKGGKRLYQIVARNELRAHWRTCPKNTTIAIPQEGAEEA